MKRTCASWDQRAALSRVAPARLRYIRWACEPKSFDELRDTQNALCDSMWGPIDTACVWSEVASGADLERKEFRDMLDFCRAHPRWIHDPGRIEMASADRFCRARGENLCPFPTSVMAVAEELAAIGWPIRFANGPTGEYGVDEMRRFIAQLQSATPSHSRRRRAARRT
jgi:hypothetical protein